VLFNAAGAQYLTPSSITCPRLERKHYLNTTEFLDKVAHNLTVKYNQIISAL